MERLSVRLGPSWMRFAHPQDGLHFIGTVTRGAAVGALARSPDGSFFQVNGDWRELLEAHRVQAALRQAGYVPGRRFETDGRRSTATGGVATVVTRRHRRTLKSESARDGTATEHASERKQRPGC